MNEFPQGNSLLCKSSFKKNNKSNKKIIHHDQVAFIPEIYKCFNTQRPINIINYMNGLKDRIT